MTKLYEDKTISCDESGITLKDYYFPTFAARVINWADIKDVTASPLTMWTGKYRIWGMGLKLAWHNLNVRRAAKNTVVFIDTGSIMKAAATPENADDFMAVIRSRIPQCIH